MGMNFYPISYTRDLIGDQLTRYLRVIEKRNEKAGLLPAKIIPTGHDCLVFHQCVICDQYKSRVNLVGICSSCKRQLEGGK